MEHKWDFISTRFSSINDVAIILNELHERGIPPINIKITSGAIYYLREAEDEPEEEEGDE